MKYDSIGQGIRTEKYRRKGRAVVPIALIAAWIGLTLTGCAIGKEADDSQNAGEIEGEWEIESITDKTDEGLRSADTPDAVSTSDNAASANTDNTLSGSAAEMAGSQSEAGDNENPPETAASQGTSTDTRSVYEQFLKNETSATVIMDDPTAEYRVPPLEKGSSYTIEQLGQKISAYFLDPEYSDKTSYDQAQYAYVNSADSAGAEKLLIKFIGLDIYAPDDNSYAVVVVSEDNGQLYVTAEYECWARSALIAYGNGTLSDEGSSGAGDHYGGVSALLSDGTIVSVYGVEDLYGQWVSAVSAVYGESDAIYQEVFGTDTYPGELIVMIYTVGDEKRYQYDMSECTEEQKILCELYLERCHDELGIEWVSHEEVQAVIDARCSELDISLELISQQPELTWSTLK